MQDHGGGLRGRLQSARSVRRRLLRAADAFLFTAREQAEPWRAGHIVGDQQAVYHVWNPVPWVRPVGRESSASIRREGQPAVLWVGRLNANKDPIAVLDGFRTGTGGAP